ncbi:MAG: hypothetical protein D6775_14055 [Caldilineae bacterium]|nr:MAG: hypothetical protein D6775_14055 [Caldilineae bacterium]
MKKNTNLESSLEALSEIISEQRNEISRLKNSLNARSDAAQRNTNRIHKLMSAAARVITWRKLQDAWRDDREPEWKEYRELLHELRMELIENGWCFYCNSPDCFGECREDG